MIAPRSIFILATLLALAGGCATPTRPPARRFDSLDIQGTARFDDQVAQALELLRAKSPAAYGTVTNQVGIIRQEAHSGMQASKTPPVFDLNDRSAFYSVTWCAGAIAHDSFHSKLYHDYKAQYRRSVPREVWTGHAAEAKCLEHQWRVLMDIGAPEREINYCRTLTPDYADVSYGKRNW